MSRTVLAMASAAILLAAWLRPPQSLTRGPYVQSVGESGGIVVWRTAAAATGLLRIDGREIATPSGTEHVAQVGGLSPSQDYQYEVVGLASGTLRTAGPGAFRFLAWGDSGTGSTAQYNVAARMAAVPDVDFALGLGDLVYESGAAADFDPKLFRPYAPMLPRMCFWPTLGNHDAGTGNGAPFYAAFYLPTGSGASGRPSGTERYYSFNWGDAHFTCLDSESSSSSPSGAMWQWAEDDLAAAQSATWRVVFMHHPPYSKGTHDSDGESELVTLRQNLVPLFDAQNVDLVLVGHSHNYERSYGLRASAVVDGSSPFEAGAAYVVSGCGGKSGGGSLDHPLMEVSYGNLTGFSYFDVSSTELRGYFVRSDGAQLDAFSLTRGPPGVPVAAFDVATSGLTAIFTDRSVGATSWAWNFGDGATSATRSPSHAYAAEGDYLVGLDVAGPGGVDSDARTVHVAPAPPSLAVWISDAELALLPASGPEWDNLSADADRDLSGANLGWQDEEKDSWIFAAALRASKYRVDGHPSADAERARVEAAILGAIGSESSSVDALAPSRNVCAVVLAADLVGLDVSAWVLDVRSRVWPDGRSIISTHEDRPNNWGTHAGASRLACSIYLRDWPDVAHCARVLAGWLGYRSIYASFEYGDLCWQENPSAPVGVNHGNGVMPEEQRRCGCSPCKTNYAYEAMQGVVTQGVLFDRLGAPGVWNVRQRAIRRAYVWLRDENEQPLTDPVNGSNDWWQAFIVNKAYPGLGLEVPPVTRPGRSVGYAEWTALAPSWP